MLNKKESDTLNVLVEYINQNGYAPSVREIMQILGLKSPSTVHRYLKRLQSKGFIERKENFSRAIRVIKEDIM